MLKLTRNGQQYTATHNHMSWRYTGRSPVDALRGLARHWRRWHQEPVIHKMAQAVDVIADRLMEGVPYPELFGAGVNLVEVSFSIGVE
jgi:hypothetical protein